VFCATITVAGETKAILKLGYLNRTDKEQILIADLPIRNARKSSALNKMSVSNRQKKRIFRKSDARQPKPRTGRSNRNSQELKTDVTS